MSSRVALSRVDEFAAAVSGRLAPDQVLDAQVARFAVDGMVPDLAVEPAGTDELAACLAEADAAGVAVIPLGGGTHAAAANVPEGYDIAVSLGRMDAVLDHEPADLTVTVQAGLTLNALQRTLAAHGQFLPLDPPGDAARMTVGGVLASDASGPSRHAYGTARDWLIGARVVHADGAVSKAGGRVVKNVAGYDMNKLYIGSLGTLAVIAEATFKVAPLPKTEATAVIACDSPHGVATLLLAAADAGLALRAAELLSPPAADRVLGEHRWCAMARVGGGPGAVDRTLRELHELAAGLHGAFAIRETATAWEAWSSAFAPASLTLRVAVLPSQVADAVELLDRRFIGSGAMLSATLAAGVVRAQLEPTREVRARVLLERARGVAQRFGGHVRVDAAPPTVKREIDVFAPVRPEYGVMQRLKQEFDPRRRLSPGRFAGRM